MALVEELHMFVMLCMVCVVWAQLVCDLVIYFSFLCVQKRFLVCMVHNCCKNKQWYINARIVPIDYFSSDACVQEAKYENRVRRKQKLWRAIAIRMVVRKVKLGKKNPPHMTQDNHVSYGCYRSAWKLKTLWFWPDTWAGTHCSLCKNVCYTKSNHTIV